MKRTNQGGWKEDEGSRRGRNITKAISKGGNSHCFHQWNILVPVLESLEPLVPAPAVYY